MSSSATQLVVGRQPDAVVVELVAQRAAAGARWRRARGASAVTRPSCRARRSSLAPSRGRRQRIRMSVPVTSRAASLQSQAITSATSAGVGDVVVVGRRGDERPHLVGDPAGVGHRRVDDVGRDPERRQLASPPTSCSSRAPPWPRRRTPPAGSRRGPPDVRPTMRPHVAPRAMCRRASSAISSAAARASTPRLRSTSPA